MGGKRGKAAKGALGWLGATLATHGGQDVFGTVQSGSPAENAGLAAGDVAVALDNLQLTAQNFDHRLQEYRPGDQATLTVFRGDELMRFRATLQTSPADTCYLIKKDDCTADQVQRRQAWLSG